MCWASSKTVWGGDLPSVQDAILAIASTIAEFEPLTVLARREEIASVRKLLKGVDVVEAPVDDLWARDTLPNFLTRTLVDGTIELAANHARFNGWVASKFRRATPVSQGSLRHGSESCSWTAG